MTTAPIPTHAGLDLGGLARLEKAATPVPWKVNGRPWYSTARADALAHEVGAKDARIATLKVAETLRPSAK